MTCTSPTSLRRRRLAAAVLALPLSLAMAGTAFAAGGSTTAELRTAGVSATAADKAADNAAVKAEAKADKAETAAAPAADAAARKAEPKAGDVKAEARNDARSEAKAAQAEVVAERKAETGAAAGAASGKTAATATTAAATATGGSYVNGNSNSSKADRPTAPVPGTPSQPISKADSNGTGANPGTAQQCAATNPYCSNGTGKPSGNGVGDGAAVGKPCAGCVGKADNKNPKGQAPGGSDHNAGYECDRNQGIGKTNPAHTGCTSTPTTPPTTPPTCPGGKPMPSNGQCPTTPPTCPGGKPMPSNGQCPTTPPTCPGGKPMPASGDKKDCDNGGGGDTKVSVCHATGSATNPFVLIEISDKALDAHRAHGDKVLTAGQTAASCPGGTSNNDKITICHATGSATNPFVVITIDRSGLNGHAGHAGDIIPAPASGVCGTSTTPPQPPTCPGGGAMPSSGTCPTNPPVDVCPDQPGMQHMGPCSKGTPPNNGGGNPIGGVTPPQPATGTPVVGPPTRIPPAIVPNAEVPPTITGITTRPATRPSALPFTGTDALLLAELGGLLLLVGGGVLVAGRRKGTVRAA